VKAAAKEDLDYSAVMKFLATFEAAPDWAAPAARVGQVGWNGNQFEFGSRNSTGQLRTIRGLIGHSGCALFAVTNSAGVSGFVHETEQISACDYLSLSIPNFFDAKFHRRWRVFPLFWRPPFFAGDFFLSTRVRANSIA